MIVCAQSLPPLSHFVAAPLGQGRSIGVLALDTRHALVSLFYGHSVCHGAKILFFRNMVLVFL